MMDKWADKFLKTSAGKVARTVVAIAILGLLVYFVWFFPPSNPEVPVVGESMTLRVIDSGEKSGKVAVAFSGMEVTLVGKQWPKVIAQEDETIVSFDNSAIQMLRLRLEFHRGEGASIAHKGSFWIGIQTVVVGVPKGTKVIWPEGTRIVSLQ